MKMLSVIFIFVELSKNLMMDDDDLSKTEIVIYTIFSIFIIVLTLIFVALGCGIFDMSFSIL